MICTPAAASTPGADGDANPARGSLMEALNEVTADLDAFITEEWQGEPGYDVDGLLTLSPAPTPWELVRSAVEEWFEGLMGRRREWEWRRVPARHTLPVALKRKYGIA